MASLGGLLAVALACATELYEAIPLPNRGHGSVANSGFMDYTDDSCMVVGYEYDAQGRRTAAAWDLDNDGLFGDAQVLPLLPFMEGEAVAGAIFPNGDRIIVGNVFVGSSSNVHAVIWRRSAGGDWGLPQFLADNNSNSIVNSGDYHDDSTGRFGAAGAVRINGQWRPFFLDCLMTSFDFRMLPAPPGNAMATGVDGSTAQWPVLCGWATFPSSVRACLWDLDNDGAFGIQPVNLGTNSPAALMDVFVQDGMGRGIGTATRNNRSRALVASFTADDDPDHIMLPPLPGFENSSGVSGYNLGDTGTHEVGHWAGFSSNDGGAPVPTVWIDVHPIRAQQFLADPGSLPSIVSYEWDFDYNGNIVDEPLGIVSYAWDFGDGTSAVIRPSGWNAPDVMNLMLGRFRNGGSYPNLWHRDGEAVVIATENVNGQRMAELELGFTPSNGTGDALMGTFVLGCRAVSNQVGAAGNMMIHVYDFEAGQFVELRSVRVTDDNPPQTITVTVASGSMSKYQNPTNGQIKVCLEFIGEGNRPIGLAIDDGLWYLH